MTTTEQQELIDQHNAARAIRPDRALRRRLALPLRREAERKERIAARRTNPPGFKQRQSPKKGHTPGKWVGRD